MTKSILTNKIFLYLTEFFAGMSVMAVELGASRLLAPYFSSSQIVWTIIIGTIMIAMALGNIYGGRMADKDPNPDKLYKRIVIAAIWIGLIPVVGKYIVVAIAALLVFAINSNLLVVASFLSCIVLFVFPLFLLGTVTPSLAKYTTDSLADNGKIIGMLGGFNTIGSIIGTFIPTFVTIPALGTSITFLIFAGILLIIAIIYFINRRRVKPIVVGVVVFVLCSIFGSTTSFAFWDNDLTYEGESVYNYLQVKEDSKSVNLSTNVLIGVQSVYRKDEALSGMYYDYAMAAPYMAGIKELEARGQDMNLLILGMGSGTYATQLSRYFDNINITGVEIDEKITDLAHEYFELPEDTNVTTYDGRAYLDADNNKYDVIMVDAYQDITIPFQMSSTEFFESVRSHLNPGGVMVVNMNMYFDDDLETEPTINTYLTDTIDDVFGNVVSIDIPNSMNRVLFVSESSDYMNRFAGNMAQEKNRSLYNLMGRVSKNVKPYEGSGHILTDDKAPVELLGMQQIDRIINKEITYYKNIYNQFGIKGLIDELL